VGERPAVSFHALQRVTVRMLFDPGFAAAVFDRPQDALADVAISADELRWLTATDRRAWRLDPLRRSRTLLTLIEEFPVSAATVCSMDGQASRLDAFFSSAHFHEAIQTRLALVGAFGAFIVDADVPELTPMARIEAAIARCRRSEESAALPAGHLALAPGYEVLRLPGGTLARFGAIVAQLDATGPTRVEAMLADGFRLRGVETMAPADTQHLLVEPGSDGPGLGELSEALARLLLVASNPVGRSVLLEAAVDLGAGVDEAVELVAELVADGVLVQRV